MVVTSTARTGPASGPLSEAGHIIAFILGMGRSGSSALARVMSLCGGRLPELMLPPNQANPTGFWEPASAVHANARFLKASGSSFFDTQLVQQVSEEDLLGCNFVSEITTLLQASEAVVSNAPLIFKEPRISVLLPFWLAAVARTNFSPRVVIPVRHPNEVASSLGAWKGLPEAHTAKLWLKYNLLAERHTRHLSRVFVSYARLMTDWRREVIAISEALGLALTPNDEVDQFLKPELRHATTNDEAVSSEVPWLSDTYRAFSSACRGDEIDIGLLDCAFLDLSRAQAQGSLPVVRTFGTDFGVA
jgi:hypothetical protein